VLPSILLLISGTFVLLSLKHARTWYLNSPFKFLKVCVALLSITLLPSIYIFFLSFLNSVSKPPTRRVEKKNVVWILCRWWGVFDCQPCHLCCSLRALLRLCLSLLWCCRSIYFGDVLPALLHVCQFFSSVGSFRIILDTSGHHRIQLRDQTKQNYASIFLPVLMSSEKNFTTRWALFQQYWF